MAKRMNYTYHGYCTTVIYKTWTQIKQRCYNKNSPDYQNYGGRGIKLHEDWVNYPRAFYDWVINNLGERPEGLTLDRIENEKGYEPGNLRWASPVEQALNRRNSGNLTCRRGHPYDEENTYIIPKRNQRSCRKCSLMASHKYLKKIKSNA